MVCMQNIFKKRQDAVAFGVAITAAISIARIPDDRFCSPSALNRYMLKAPVDGLCGHNLPST